MQHPPSHHWFSSLFAGLCIVAGFGLGILWHEQGIRQTTEETSSLTTPEELLPGEDTYFCSTIVSGEDKEKDKNTDKDKDKDAKKSRNRWWVRPRGLTDEQMKRVEEALKRAQESLDKEGMELPEEFRQHMEQLQKHMQEHQKLLEEQFRQFEEQFKGQFPEGFPKNFRNLKEFRFPNVAPGSGTAIMLNRNNDGFTVERREGTQSIKVTGTVADGKSRVDTITITEGGKEKTYKDLKEVPEAQRDRVKELIEMATTGRVIVREKKDQPAAPKKDSRHSKPAEKEFY